MPNHRCSEQDIDYSQVDSGFVQCTVCHRAWVLDPVLGWMMQPKERAPGRRRMPHDVMKDRSFHT